MNYITLSKAEEITGIKADTLKKRCQEGQVKGAIKIGKTWFVLRSEMTVINPVNKSGEIQSSWTLKYEGFEIELWNEGFDPSVSLHRITSWLVHKSGIFCVFVFREGLLDRMSHPEIKSENLEQMQLEEITSKIDGGELQNKEEYTFQLYGTNYLQEEKVDWWKKTLSTEK